VATSRIWPKPPGEKSASSGVAPSNSWPRPDVPDRPRRATPPCSFGASSSRTLAMVLLI